MYSAFEIANKILDRAANNDAGDLISNLKLQKLLYYMQGFHLAFFEKPLFKEEIHAWQYGPVVPEVYSHYRENGNRGILPEAEVIVLKDEEEELFDKVFSVYGDYSALGLMNLTHNEAPWINAPQNEVISLDSMLKFFQTRIN